MTSSSSESLQPFFLDGSRGPLFALYYAPSKGVACKRNILLVPSFAEEMNRCRSMVSMQARRLAQIGIGTLMLDAYGTGDSAGEFAELSWESWRNDLEIGLDWLRLQPGGCDTMWGVRTGALLAAEFVARQPGLANLLLWQPVLNGKLFFNQFLRIRIAADLEKPNGVKKTEDLQKILAEGNLIEVSGYQVSGALARGIEAALFPTADQLASKRVAWFEVVGEEGLAVGRTNQQYVDGLQAKSESLHFEKVVGELFWQVHERAVAPALLDATVNALEQRT